MMDSFEEKQKSDTFSEVVQQQATAHFDVLSADAEVTPEWGREI